MPLDALPPSDDKYWEGADVNKHVLRDSPEHDHSFVRKEGMNVECECGLGFVLSPGYKVIDGQLIR